MMMGQKGQKDKEKKEKNKATAYHNLNQFHSLTSIKLRLLGVHSGYASWLTSVTLQLANWFLRLLV